MSQYSSFHNDLRRMLRSGEIDTDFYLKATAECAFGLMSEGALADSLYLVAKLTPEWLDGTMPQQAEEDPIFEAHILGLAQGLVDRGYVVDGGADTSLLAPISATKARPS